MSGRELSPAGAGCMLLIWGQPTDRALTGWAPYPCNLTTEEAFVKWMAEQVQMNMAEAALHAGDVPDTR